MKDSIVFIKHILQSIDKIELSLGNVSKEEFLNNSDLQDATIRRIEVIGEAVKNLPIPFIKKYPKIEWKKIAGIRDKVIHGYFGVDLEIIWNVWKYNLPDLKKKIHEILKSENTE